MTTPDPQPQSVRQRKRERRARLEAFEAAATGGIKHIGHLPIFVDELEGWTFRRCRCGSTLALSPSGRIYWLRMADTAKELLTFVDLLRPLASHCWQHRPQGFAPDPRNSSVAPAASASAPIPATATPPAPIDAPAPIKTNPVPQPALSRPELALRPIPQPEPIPPPVKRLQTFVLRPRVGPHAVSAKWRA